MRQASFYTNLLLLSPHKRRSILVGTAIVFLLLETILCLTVDEPLAFYTKSLDQSSPAFIDFFRAITNLGLSKWYLWPCGIATIFCAFLARGKDVREAYRQLFAYIGTRTLFLFATVGISGIVCDIIKPILGRARPIMGLRDGIYGISPFTRLGFAWNSMPSGHATTAFALACSLTILYPRGRLLWFIFALLVSASRVMVDAHYLSDVCAGAVLGWLTTEVFFNHGMLRIRKVIFPIDSASNMQ
jgi:undecaprenyl-diphosphatase